MAGMNTPPAPNPIIGSDEHRYEVLHDWGALPARITYGNCHGVAEDSKGLIYIHHTVHETSESPDSVVVFDPDGNFVHSWGKEFKGGAHGFHLQKEGGEEFFYFCDIDRRIVVKTTLEGEEVLRLGYPYESENYEPKPDGSQPDYRPTNLAIAPNGDIYIGDGYGSSCILQYDKKGNYIRTFGGLGSEAGQVSCPHGIICDTRSKEPVILVADRANNRLQEFSLAGEHRRFYYLHPSVLSSVNLPCHFHIRKKEMVIPDLAARVTLLDANNDVITHLGEGTADYRQRRLKSSEHFPPGKFVCPHGACFDHEGNIFVTEWVEVGRVTKLNQIH